MPDFTFEDYTIDDIERYNEAIHQLIKIYNHPYTKEYGFTAVAKIEITGNALCPLCAISRDSCEDCPWVTLEHKRCWMTGHIFTFPSPEDIEDHLSRLDRWKTKFEERWQTKFEERIKEFKEKSHA